MAFGLYGLSALGSGAMKGLDDSEESRLRQAKLMLEKQQIDAAALDQYENQKGGAVLLKYPDLATLSSPFAPQRPTPPPGQSSTGPPIDDPAYTISPSQAARVNAQPPAAPSAPGGPTQPNIPAMPGGPSGPGPVGPAGPAAGPAAPPAAPQGDPRAPIVPRPVQTVPATSPIGTGGAQSAEQIAAMPGGADLRRIIEKIRESDPNIKPEAMFGILTKMNKILSPESKQLLDWMKYQLASDRNQLGRDRFTAQYGQGATGPARTAFDLQPGEALAGMNRDAIIDAARVKADTGRYPTGITARTAGSGGQALRAMIDNTAALFARDPNKLAESPDVVGHRQDVEAAKVAALAGPRAAARALGDLTIKQTAITAFEKTALKNYKTLLELADKVDYSGVPLLQRWIKGGMKAGGSTDVNNFDFQVKALKSEVGKILNNPNLTGVLTDEARRSVEEIGADTTPAMLRAIGPLLQRDFDNRKDALDEGMDAIKQTIQGYRNRAGTPGVTATPPATPGAGGGAGTDFLGILPR